MAAKSLAPRLTLETLVEQSPTRTTSLLRLHCPFCGCQALTEKFAERVYGLTCGVCEKRSLVEVR